MDHLSELTGRILEAALRAGADEADAIAISSRSVSIDVLKGKLEHAERSEGIEIGLRVLIGRKQACVSSSDIRDELIETMADRAVAMAAEAPDDPHAGLAEGNQLSSARDARHLEIFQSTEPPAPAQLEELARVAEAAASDVDGVSQVQSASAGHSRTDVHLTASNGFDGGYSRSSGAISVVAISGSGTSMERDYHGEQRVYMADLPQPESIGVIAGERAARRLGARKPPTGNFPVIFDERIASSLVGHLLTATNGSSIARGSSWALHHLGKQILPEGLSIIEDPHRKRIGGSRPFDGEGLPTARRAIVDNGVLTGWTLDLATGRQLGMSSTGNASRGTSAPPSPSVGNVELIGGTGDLDGLLKEAGTGLLVTSLIGSTINPNTGDYSRGASGFWVENGEVSYPVNECTIAGNLIEMLGAMLAADDGRRHLSRVVPSLMIPSMTLAGS